MAKAKFDSAKMKKALAAHAEKIGFGAAFIVTVLLLAYGFAVEPYKRNPKDPKATEPSELQSLVARIRARITGPENKTPDAFNMAKDGVVLPSVDEEPKKVIDRLLLADLSPALFAGIEWNKPLFDQKQRRREPEYLALRDLRAAYYHSAVDMALRGAPGADGGKAVALGREWISVTGVVPLEDQTIEYVKAFQSALDTTTNSAPEYGVYQLQRAVVDYADLEKPIDWQKIEPVDLKLFVTDEIGSWAGTATEFVDKKFAREPLTQPLPVLSNGDYGDWAAHAPEIPAPGGSVAPAASAASGAAPAAAPQGNLFGGSSAPRPATNNAQAAKPAEVDPKAAPAYLLFRFLDFKVEARKFYRYRVKLVVKNPNFGLEGSHLEKPELAQGETRETAWSQPTPPVGVPVHEHFFAGAMPVVNGETEPLANVGVRKWYPPLGADIYYEFDKRYRGASLNDPAANVAYVVPRERKGTKGTAKLKSDALLADFSWEKNENRLRGPASTIPGQEPKPCSRPSELLVLTARGELLIQTELADAPLRDEMNQIGGGGAVANPVAGGGGAPVPAGAVNAPPANPETDVKKILKLK